MVTKFISPWKSILLPGPQPKLLNQKELAPVWQGSEGELFGMHDILLAPYDQFP